MTAAGAGWPRDPSEEDLERLRPDVEGYGRILGPAVVEETRRTGGMPTVGRLISVIVESIERDAWLQELAENEISTEDALTLAHGIRIETRAVLEQDERTEGS